MASTTSLGSGIDVNGIVSAMVDAQKTTLNRMNKSKSIYNAQLSDYTSLNNLLTNFTNSVGNMSQILGTTNYSANSSNTSVMNAVLSGANVSPGIYSLAITQLATAHQIASNAFSSKDTATGIADTLTVTTGSNSFTLSVNATDSLETIRDNINTSNLNESIVASILSTTASDGVTSEYRLVLTSEKTGTAQAMTLSGGAELDFGLSNVLSAAQDALFKFDGFDVVRGENTVSDLLDGITLSLNQASSSATLTVSADNGSQVNNVATGLNTMVNNYNAIISAIDNNQATKYIRDTTYSLIKLQLQNMMNQSFGTGTISSLLSLGIGLAPSQELVSKDGIEYVSSGSLKINTNTLNSVLNENYSLVKDFFTADNSFISTTQSSINNITKLDGTLPNRKQIIQQQEYLIEQQMDRETSRLDTVKDNLINQYSKLDLYIQHYQQISNFLQQQMDSMNHNRMR